MNSFTEKPQFAITLRNDEGGLVIEALAECPFKQVYDLIGRLNQQANASLAHGAGPDDPVEYMMSAADMKLIAAALGNLPFNRVHSLLESLQSQLHLKTAKGA
ncbi:MAG: hypothetical protein A3I66_04255 [Burkholderiales bacterium RIFCSPLOWO2_02_FULL_57_36]|nr:MAG: hypothetical protein A3I66_04255 [Burkholderiales bacterium RIFCSPLOWO2_02_FULL_57_36]